MRQIIKTPLSVWSEELSSDLCDSLIAEGLWLPLENATIDTERNVNENIRKNKVGWFELNTLIDNLLLNYVLRTNLYNEWNFQITDREKPQFTVYEKDAFYTWHRDSNVTRPLERKISVTVQLSDPSTYEGGEFKIQDYWGEKELSIYPQAALRGTIIIFPSILKHIVTPVTEGTRYSIVQWYSGPDFT